MKVVFFGTPEILGVKPLYALINSKHTVIGVVCKPDKPSGRGKHISSPPSKLLAQKHNIPVFQFNSVSKEGIDTLKALNPDIFIISAFGQILSQKLIDIPKYGSFNIHYSLLPKYRGPAPIQWPIIEGETETGVTFMKIDAGIDTGDIVAQVRIPIKHEDTAKEMYERLSDLGVQLMLENLKKIENKTIIYTKQNHEKSSYYPMIKKEDAKIDFNKSCEQIVNHIRGLNYAPVAYFMYNGGSYKVYEARVAECEYEGKNGEVLESSSKKGLIIKCKDGCVEILSLCAPNSKVMKARQFLNGNNIEKGIILN